VILLANAFARFGHPLCWHLPYCDKETIAPGPRWWVWYWGPRTLSLVIMAGGKQCHWWKDGFNR
jgi:hypothetical protein